MKLVKYLWASFVGKAKNVFASCWIGQNPVMPQMIRLLDCVGIGMGRKNEFTNWKDILPMCHLTNLWGSERWTLDQNERCLLAAPLRAWKAAWFLFCIVSTRRRTDHSQHQCVHPQHLEVDSPAFFRLSSLRSMLSLLDWQKRMMYPWFWLLLDRSA